MAMTASAFPTRQPPSSAGSARLNFDIPDALLAEMDFKWLMAGQGHHVDVARLHEDPDYAGLMLGLALASEIQSLRDCAAVLAGSLQRPVN